jgi:hypothetical protein
VPYEVTAQREVTSVLKRDQLIEGWRELHYEELHYLFSSPDIIRMTKSRRMRWTEHIASMGEKMSAYRFLVGNPEGMRPLGRPRRRWEDDIKMYLRERTGLDSSSFR